MADYVVDIAESVTATDAPASSAVVMVAGVYERVTIGDEYTYQQVISQMAESVTVTDAYSISAGSSNLTIVEGVRTLG